MALTYLDFEIEIGVTTGRDYPVAVLHSPAGEARTVALWSLSELQLDNRLKDLQIALLSSGGVRRQILSPAEQAVQAFGRELFDWLFTGEVRNRYDVSKERARQQGKGLRIKLRIQSPVLAALPWEYLYDSRTAEYLCLSRTTPVVRYLELPQTIQPLAVTPPLQVLGMIASPTDLQPLDINLEKTRIARAIADLEAQGLVQWTWLPGQTWRDLQRALRRGPWHIFHFTGHGMFDTVRDEGMVALADADGKAHLFSATDLGRLLVDHQTLRLVLLNSCESAQSGARDIFAGTAATLIRRGLPAVVAMQYAITDRAAIEFAQTFYESLADQLAIDAAVAEARKAISVGITNSLEWGTPVLHLRAPDGQLFAQGAALQSEPHPAPKTPPPSLPPAAEGETPVLDRVDQPVAQTEAASSTVAKPLDRPTLFAKLRAVLATLYSDETSTRRVATDAGLEIARIPFTGQATNNWHAILGEADKTGQIDDLLAVAQREYGDNPGLREAVAAWRAQAGAPRSVSRPAASPVEPAVMKIPAEMRTAEKRANAAPVYPTTTIPFDWVTIPAGEFLMGSDKDKDKEASDDELPQHKLYLPEYRIARVPVTNLQYREFVKTMNCSAPGHWQNGQIPKGKEKHPVVYVSWHDAIAFCEWAKVRLSTEAEWEKAARGTDGRIYPWGNEPPDKSRCNFNMDVADTTPVDKYLAGASFYDCLDMAGNVWEWTSTKWLSNYQDYASKVDNALSGAEGRVLRGGAWINNQLNVRCASRSHLVPDYGCDGVGFRVVAPGSGTLASGG
ncbi:MAG: SUMF1/EgtB/PvdO family nonheme iron enzyme [Caldilineaceae bacterium]